MGLNWEDAPQKYPVFLVFIWYSVSAPFLSLRFSIPSLVMRLHLSSQIWAQAGRGQRGKSRGLWAIQSVDSTLY